MPRSFRRNPLIAAICFAASLPAAALPAPPPPKPLLAVVIAVDGLSYARLVAYRPLWTAGFKRLLDEGFDVRETRYGHLNTETGPGHASLGTGAPPRVTGIVLNSWFEPGPDGGLANVYCTDQKDASGKKIPGPGNLRVPTLGDRLVEAAKGARVVSVSAKDRSAIFLAGRNRGHAVYWYDGASGRFRTSSAYRPPEAAAAAVARFNDSKGGDAIRARFGAVWEKLPEPPQAPGAPPVPTAVPLNTIARFQYPTHGLGFGHDLSTYGRVPSGGPFGYLGGIYRSPFVDVLTADLALELLADPALALGRGAAPDLLAISFSGHDPVAHDYGDESEESRDALRRLDLEIGRVLAALDAFPKGSVLVAFSSDHGFPVMPEVARILDKSAAGGRLETGRDTPNNARARLNRLLDDALCLDRSVQIVGAVDGWSLFYRRAAFPLSTVEGPCGPAGSKVSAADVDRVLPKIARMFWDEEIEDVLPVSGEAAWPDTRAARFARNDFDRERSGDVFVIPRRGVMSTYNPGRGAMHGTHHEYDVHVPLVFWGAVKAGASDAPATPYDLAPTLGRWLGVSLPEATGKAIDLPR